jgi:hypothetical protein
MECATAIRMSPLDRAPDLALRALADDPARALVLTVPPGVRLRCAAVPPPIGPRPFVRNVADFAVKPFPAARLRGPIGHHILSRFVVAQENEFHKLVQKASFIGRDVAFAMQMRRNGLSSFSTLARLAAVAARGRMRTGLPPAFNAGEMLQRCYRLVTEIAAQERKYVCTVLNIVEPDEDELPLDYEDVARMMR